MLDTDARSLVEQGDLLFDKKRTLDTRNQDIADQFYPERADFTVTRDIGDQFADHLITGYPSMVRRDLGNSFGAMLRPKAQEWFDISTDASSDGDHEAKAWLDDARRRMRRAIYDDKSMFTRATKEGDHDFAAFGNCVISTEVNRRDTSLLYRCWHLRDVAWQEDQYGCLGEIHRAWKPGLRDAVKYFEGKCHQKMVDRAQKEPHGTCTIRHVVIRSDCYGDKFRQPWTSLYIDTENQHILEARGSWTPIYTIPRWQTVSGSQYGLSPATIIALPDARLLQAMMLTLLDAGERAANPPLIGVKEAIRGDMNLFPGGFTAVDAAYDERLGEVLRPLVTDKTGLPFGIELADRTSQMLREAFYLNALSMPPHDGPEMTAFEVGQRVQEYIRQALPLFEPMEADYNGALCDITFTTLMHEGAFGPPERIPETIRGKDVEFSFESPLAEMIERQKGQKFLEAKSMVAQAIEVDTGAAMIIDFGEALRDVLGGIGTPTKWLRSPEQVNAAQEAAAQEQQAAQMLAAMQQGADVAQKLGQASESFGPVV